MPLTLQAPQQITKFYREAGAEEAFEQTPEEREAITYPPDNQYRFTVVGVSEFFEMNKSEEFGGGVQTMIRLEFEISEGKAKGRKFQTICSAGSIGPKSNLRKLWNAAELVVPEGGDVDLTELIGCTVQGYVTVKEKIVDGQARKHTNISWDTLKPVASGSSNGNAKGAGAPDDDWED